MSNSTTVADIIRPIINDTYGKSEFIDAMIGDVAKTIDERNASEFAPLHSREHTVMCKCWDWMAGGSTAGSVACKIEAALVEAGL